MGCGSSEVRSSRLLRQPCAEVLVEDLVMNLGVVVLPRELVQTNRLAARQQLRKKRKENKHSTIQEGRPDGQKVNRTYNEKRPGRSLTCRCIQPTHRIQC